MRLQSGKLPFEVIPVKIFVVILVSKYMTSLQNRVHDRHGARLLWHSVLLELSIPIRFLLHNGVLLSPFSSSFILTVRQLGCKENLHDWESKQGYPRDKPCKGGLVLEQ